MTAQKKVAAKNPGMLKIKWVVSFIACTDDMRQTIRGLGLRRLHQVVERQDTPAVRGMIHKVRHLVGVVGEEMARKTVSGRGGVRKRGQHKRATPAPKERRAFTPGNL